MPVHDPCLSSILSRKIMSLKIDTPMSPKIDTLMSPKTVCAPTQAVLRVRVRVRVRGRVGVRCYATLLSTEHFWNNTTRNVTM